SERKCSLISCPPDDHGSAREAVRDPGSPTTTSLKTRQSPLAANLSDQRFSFSLVLDIAFAIGWLRSISNGW
ncbi:hypothetical protein BaRGS_00021266, partial [Batillaria attramentaria]